MEFREGDLVKFTIGKDSVIGVLSKGRFSDRPLALSFNGLRVGSFFKDGTRYHGDTVSSLELLERKKKFEKRYNWVAIDDLGKYYVTKIKYESQVVASREEGVRCISKINESVQEFNMDHE